MFFRKIYGSWEGIQKQKHEKIFKAMRALGARPPGIDIGAGVFMFKYPFDFVRVDIQGNVDVLADGSRLPFRHETFNTTLSVDSLHLFSWKEAERVLAKGGMMFASLPWSKRNLLDDVGMEKVMEAEIPGREKEALAVFKKK